MGWNYKHPPACINPGKPAEEYPLLANYLPHKDIHTGPMDTIPEKHLPLTLPVLVLVWGGSEATGKGGPRSHS